jgi:hypothetical protein
MTGKSWEAHFTELIQDFVDEYAIIPLARSLSDEALMNLIKHTSLLVTHIKRTFPAYFIPARVNI